MEAIKFGNLALTFLLELVMLGALCYWGFHLEQGLLVRIVLGIGSPLAAAVIWGTFLSPKASIPLPDIWIIVLKAAVFGAAAAALFASGHGKLGASFAVIVVVNYVLNVLWDQ